MTPAEQSNLPRHRGEDGFYEIWFVVFFEKGARRATWIRYTIFVSNDGTSRRATLWAAAFDGSREPRKIVTKHVVGVDKLHLAEDRFEVTIGEATLTHGALRGASESGGHRIAWDLGFDTTEGVAVRTPKFAHRFSLATEAAHASADVAFRGWVEVDGFRRTVENAIGTQVHIWGTRRIEELAWVYVPGVLEVTCARPKRTTPTITSIWMPDDDLTQLPHVITNRLEIVAPGIVDVFAGTRRVRAFCDLETMVGYVYRDPDGRDLYVAQSDLASVEIETLARAGLGRSPKNRFACLEQAALEIHGPDPLPGVAYIPWVSTTPIVVTPAPRGRSIPPPPSGSMVDTEDPRRIVAFGLTYRGHVDETGSGAESVAFEKKVTAWLDEGRFVFAPTTEEIAAALDALEPGLEAELARRYGFIPAILDYEAELAMMVMNPEEGRIAWFVANDITARSVQVLGEGRPNPLVYWSAAKSFPSFLPVGEKMWLPDAPYAVPDVTLTTTVNGVVRQKASSKDLTLSPRVMLERAKAVVGGELARGDVILTGTPAGIGFEVGRAKRWLGSKLLDRFGRLEAAFTMYAKSTKLLRPGDRVEVEAGFLGRRVVEIAMRDGSAEP